MEKQIMKWALFSHFRTFERCNKSFDLLWWSNRTDWREKCQQFNSLWLTRRLRHFLPTLLGFEVKYKPRGIFSVVDFCFNLTNSFYLYRNSPHSQWNHLQLFSGLYTANWTRKSCCYLSFYSVNMGILWRRQNIKSFFLWVCISINYSFFQLLKSYSFFNKSNFIIERKKFLIFIRSGETSSNKLRCSVVYGYCNHIHKCGSFTRLQI